MMMRTTWRYLTAAVAALALLAAAAAQQDDASAISAARQQWQEAYNAGDVMAIAALYTEDAALYDADGRVAEGREAIRALLEEETADVEGGRTQIMFEPIETQVEGDFAYDLGRFTLTSPAGEMFEGHFLVILRRGESGWLIHRQIANFIPPEGEGEMGGGGG